MPTLADLLADDASERVPILVLAYMDEAGVEQTLPVTTRGSGWDDPPGGPFGQWIRPLLNTGFRLSESFDPLDPVDGDDSGGYTEIELINDHADADLVGFFRNANRWSVDSREQLLYMVGRLSTGVRVELADVLATPFQRLVGVDRPTAGDDERCRVTVRTGAHHLAVPFQRVTYSPPCAVFPSGAGITFGNNYNQTGSFHVRFKVYLENPAQATPLQYPAHKDSGAAGWYLAVGSVAGGTVSGGIEIGCRGQTPVGTATAAGVLLARTEHIVEVDVNVGAGTREIVVDGVSRITSTGVTGSPTTSATTFTLGLGVTGRISELVIYSTAKTITVANLEARVPVLPTDANLAALIPLDEGVGGTAHDRKSGSSITGTCGAGVVLTGTAGWHYSGLAGKQRPSGIGRLRHHPVTWVNPPLQQGELGYLGIQLLQVLRSGYAAVSTGSYIADYPRGIVRLTSGSIAQAGYGAQVLMNSPWGTALNFDGSTMTALATQAAPTGSRGLSGHIRIDNLSATLRIIGGWLQSASGGGFYLCLTNTGGNLNRPAIRAFNNAGTQFELIHGATLTPGRRYFVGARLDASGQRLSLWLDRAEVASVTTSGLWSTARTEYGLGCRGDTGGSIFTGIIDDFHAWSVAPSDAQLKAHFLDPIVGNEVGLWYGHHLNDATSLSTPTTAASTVAGKAALTLVSPTWGTGRCSAGDLAWYCYELAGYVKADRDAETWGAFIASQPADCGVSILEGEEIEGVVRLLLGGVGARAFEYLGVVYVRRFEGVSGAVQRSPVLGQFIAGATIAAQPGTAPAVYLWEVECNTNALPLQASEIALALQSSSPAEYSYASKPYELGLAQDDSIRITPTGADARFPQAIPKRRRSALFNKPDGDAEAARLLALFRDGSTPVQVEMALDFDDVALLDKQAAVDGLTSAGLDSGQRCVVSLLIEDGMGTLGLWRPGNA